MNICPYSCTFNRKLIDMPDSITIGRRKYNLQAGKELNMFLFFNTNIEGWIVGMVRNQLLEKINLSAPVLKNSNVLAPRPSASYFKTEWYDKVGWIGMILPLNSSNKGSSTCPIYRILSSSTIHHPFLNSYCAE